MASETLATGGEEQHGHPDANALNTSQSVLQYFWDLASYDEDVRLSAARGLVKDLTEDQAKHEETLGKDTEPAPEDGTPKIKQLEYHLSRCSPTMVYSLRRLARGLGSSRQAARQGYATALAGVLAGSRCVTPAGVMVLLEVYNDGPVRGGDAKDTLLARLFGFGALLRSGLPLDAPALAALFNGLLDCGHRKSFLRECAAAVALEAAGRMDAAALAAVAAPGQPLAVLLAAPPAEATPEAMFLAIALWPRLPASTVRACRLLPANTPPPPAELFTPTSTPSTSTTSSSRQPLSAATATAVAATAAGMFSREHLQTVLPVLLATSASHPRMHTLWQYLLPLLLPGFRPHRNMDLDVAGAPAPAAGADEPAPPADAAGKKAAKAAKAAAAAARSAEGKGAVSGALLEAFWGVVVEGGLMNSSHERRYLGFQLFSRVLPHLRPEHVATVFSPVFTRTLTNAVKRRDTYLHASGKRLMDGISGFLERGGGGGGGGPDSGVKMAVAAALQRLGGMAPKELAAGKLTQKLVQGLDAAGVHRYVASLMEAFLKGLPPLQPEQHGAAAGTAAAEAAEGAEEGEGEGEQEVADRRRQCVDQLQTALRFPGVAEADVEAGLRFLALHAFVDVTHGSKASKSKVPEVQQAATQLAAPLAPATRTACAARLMSLLTNLHQAALHRIRTAQQQQLKHQKQQQQQQQRKAAAASAEGDAAAGDSNGAPAAKKRKTGAGAAAAAATAADGVQEADAAAAAAPPPPPPASSLYCHLHNTLAFVRKALKAPGAAPAAELGEDGDNALALLAAVEEVALQRLAALDAAAATEGAAAATTAETKDASKTPQQEKKKDKKKKKTEEEGEEKAAGEEEGAVGPRAPGQSSSGLTAARLRSLAALAAHLQLHLLADPEGFEKDLPLSLRRVAAEGLGLEGLPEVEVEEGAESEEDSEEEKKEKEGADAPTSPAASPAASWSDVLVDVLLALMARPAGSLPIAPLREVGEALWRQSCEGLSGEGLADIVRVVAAGGKGEGQDDAGLFESDEEEEEDEDEEEGGSESEDEDGDDDVEAEAEEMAGSRKKRKAAADEESEEEEEEDGDGKEGKKDEDEKGSEEEEAMDDEAMFRLDSKLAAYFKSMTGGRAGGAAAAERAAALVNFRLRALALLEMFAKKSPNSPLLLAALVPLVRALATASRPGGQPQVAARLKRVVLGNLCKGRCSLDLAVLGGAEGYSAALKRLLYEASRNRNKEVAEVAMGAFTAMVRAGAAAEQPEAAEAARSAARAALSDLLTKKKTRLAPEGLMAAFRAAPPAALPSLDLLLGCVASGRNAHVRLAAAELLARLMRSPPEGLAAALTGPVAAALGGAMAGCAAGVGLKPKQHARAVQAAVACAEGLKKLLPGKRAAEVLGADKLNAVAKAIVTVQSLSPSPSVSKALQRLGEVMSLGPLLDKTKPDPALTGRINKARPDKPEQKEKKGEEKAGGKKESGGKAEKDKKRTGDKEEGGKAGSGKKRKPEEEEEDDEEDEEMGGGSDSEAEGGSDDAEEGSDDDDDEEEEGGSEEEEESDEEEEEEDEEEKPSKKGKGKGPAPAHKGGKQGGKGGPGRGKGGKGAGAAGGAGGKGRPHNNKQQLTPGRQEQGKQKPTPGKGGQKQERKQGASPGSAKKARR